MSRATAIRLFALATAITVVVSLVMVNIDWNGFAASEEAAPIDTLLDVMIWFSSFVFSVVMVMFGYAIWKYRAKPGDESDGEPIHGNTKLEIAWTVIPTAIVLFAAGYSWVVLDDLEASEPDRMRINVTAQQYAWTFEYPEAGVSTSELVVPVDRQLELNLQSLDVLHSFWVPEWRIKRDLVPGANESQEVDNTVLVTPNEEGSYSLVCAELCGIGHATMRAFVRVVPEGEFGAWLSEQSPTGGNAPPGTQQSSRTGAGDRDAAS